MSEGCDDDGETLGKSLELRIVERLASRDRGELVVLASLVSGEG